LPQEFGQPQVIPPDPCSAFGTGQPPDDTALCLEAMEAIPNGGPAGGQNLGAASGILALTRGLLRLGAASAAPADNDPLGPLDLNRK